MNLDDPMRRRLLAAGTLPALALAGGCATPAAEAPTPAPRVPS
ncbi:MAG: hypothetical protein ACK5IH_05250 [Betaproteobacteria bacterium]